jgi:hypothetical protein
MSRLVVLVLPTIYILACVTLVDSGRKDRLYPLFHWQLFSQPMKVISIYDLEMELDTRSASGGSVSILDAFDFTNTERMKVFRTLKIFRQSTKDSDFGEKVKFISNHILPVLRQHGGLKFPLKLEAIS